MPEYSARFIEEKDPTRSVENAEKREQHHVEKPQASREVVGAGNWERELVHCQGEGARAHGHAKPIRRELTNVTGQHSPRGPSACALQFHSADLTHRRSNASES